MNSMADKSSSEHGAKSPVHSSCTCTPRRPDKLVVDVRAVTETLKSAVDVPDEETRRQWEKEAAEAADAAAAPVLSRAFRCVPAVTRLESCNAIDLWISSGFCRVADFQC